MFLALLPLLLMVLIGLLAGVAILVGLAIRWFRDGDSRGRERS
jgi:hypothetical protein